MIRVKAPGKLFLMGEHAVLNGHPALVAAVDRYIYVELTETQNNEITVASSIGNYSCSVDNLTEDPQLSFVSSAIKLLEPKRGFNLKITEDFNHQTGLGSSAAVSAATIAAIRAFKGIGCDPQDIFDDALMVIQHVQGSGSGADLAATVFGGIVYYRMTPKTIQKLNHSLAITAVYTGAKESTVSVVKMIREAAEAEPERFQKYFQNISTLVGDAAIAIENRDWQTLADKYRENHKIMVDMGLTNPHIDQIVADLEADSGISAAKISGSGLGDCVLALGTIQNQNIPHDLIDLQICKNGLSIESN